MIVEVNKEKCCGDGFCLKVCPAHNFYFDEDKKATVVDRDRFGCIFCGHCVAVCPKDAIKLKANPHEDFSGKRPNISEEDLATLIKTRRSIRAYKDKAVPREIIEESLDTMRYSPTGSNMQRVEWAVIDNKEKLAELGQIVYKWIETVPGREKVAQNYRDGKDVLLRGAPCIIVNHAPIDYWLSVQDCSVAAAYLELVLHNKGLGSCWAGYVIGAALNLPEVKEFFNVPQANQIYAGLMVGYPQIPYKYIPKRKKLRLKWID